MKISKIIQIVLALIFIIALVFKVEGTYQGPFNLLLSLILTMICIATFALIIFPASKSANLYKTLSNRFWIYAVFAFIVTITSIHLLKFAWITVQLIIIEYVIVIILGYFLQITDEEYIRAYREMDKQRHEEYDGS